MQFLLSAVLVLVQSSSAFQHSIHHLSPQTARCKNNNSPLWSKPSIHTQLSESKERDGEVMRNHKTNNERRGRRMESGQVRRGGSLRRKKARESSSELAFRNDDFFDQALQEGLSLTSIIEAASPKLTPRNKPDKTSNTLQPQAEFNIALNRLAECGEPGAAKEAERRLLGRLRSAPNHHKSTFLNVQLQMSFNTVLKAWSLECNNECSIDERDDDVSGAEHFLTKWEDLFLAGKVQVTPDRISFNSVIKSYSAQSHICRGNAAKAERVLKKMIQLSKTGISKNVRPDSGSFEMVVDAWEKCGEADSAQRGEQICNDMDELYESGAIDVRPTAVMLSKVIGSWAATYNAQRADELYQRMQRMYEAGNKSLKPDANTICSVIDAWASSTEQGAVRRADQLLRNLMDKYELGDKEMKPSTSMAFTSVIKALSKSPEKGAAMQAQKILYSSESVYGFSPNLTSYSLVLAAWAQSGEKRSGHMAGALLKEMNELHASGHRNIKPNTGCFNYVMDAWISSDVKGALERAETIFEVMESGGAEMQPDSHTYSSLINANIIARQPQRAIDLLEHMIDIYEGDDQKMKPNVDLFNTVLDACDKSCESDSGAKSLEIFLRMEVLYENGNSDLQPNTNSLNSVLNALGKSHDAETAENLLNKYSKNKYATPNTASFNAVISAWVNKDSDGSALKAESLLKQMEHMYGNGVEIVQPNLSSYNTVLSAFARSKEASSIFLAKNVLDRMILMGDSDNCSVLPDLQSFSSVLSACAHSSPEEQRKKALSVAIDTFKTLHSSKHVHQNSYIYAIFFKALANLMPRGSERNKILSNFFKLACKDGLVSNLVLLQVHHACPTDLCRKLMNNLSRQSTRDIRNLPQEWSSNTRQQIRA